MKHAIEIAGRYLGGMIAAAALSGLASAQHVRPHSGLYSLEGDVIEEPGRELTRKDGKVRGLSLAIEVVEDEFGGLGHTFPPLRRRLVLRGGAPGSLAAVHVARRVLPASETMPVGGIVVRGTFGRCGTFAAEIPETMDLDGLVAQGASLEEGMASITIDLGGSEDEAFANWTLAGRLAKPAYGVQPLDGRNARLALPRRTVPSRD
jgi:hypothetical protein